MEGGRFSLKVLFCLCAIDFCILFYRVLFIYIYFSVEWTQGKLQIRAMRKNTTLLIYLFFYFLILLFESSD